MVEALLTDLADAVRRCTDRLASVSGGVQALGYYHDLARRLAEPSWLSAHRDGGRKIVGVLCGLVPEELIRAAGAVPVRLCGSFAATVLPAEEVCPSGVCPLVKSSVGLALAAAPPFPYCDAIVVPTTCDGKKKAAEILSRRGATWVLEVPSTSQAQGGRGSWIEHLWSLLGRLESLTGRKITRKTLELSIASCNKKRAAYRRLSELQAHGQIWGRDALLATNMALYDEPDSWAAQTERLCDELRGRGKIDDRMDTRPRLILTGAPILLPKYKLPFLIEESGGHIVGDELCSGGKTLWDPVFVWNHSLDGLLAAIADKYLSVACPCFTPNLSRTARLLRIVSELRVEGVIYHVLTGCHPYGMEFWSVEKALSAKGLPVLKIETDYGEEDVEQIRTRVEAFVEMLAARRIS